MIDTDTGCVAVRAWVADAVVVAAEAEDDWAATDCAADSAASVRTKGAKDMLSGGKVKCVNRSTIFTREEWVYASTALRYADELLCFQERDLGGRRATGRALFHRAEPIGIGPGKTTCRVWVTTKSDPGRATRPTAR